MQRLLVTRVGRRFAGWLSGDLSEVAAIPKLFSLPSALPYIRGTAFRRGRLVTVVNTHEIMNEQPESAEGGLLLRLAQPLAHLAFVVPSVEAVVPYAELSLREDGAEGIWAGMYPWEEMWVNVVKPAAVAEEIYSTMATTIHHQAAGREHAS